MTMLGWLYLFLLDIECSVFKMDNFAEQMRKIANKTNKNIDKVVRGAVLSLSKRIIQMTPVGNPNYWKSKKAPPGYTGGTAKGNWFASIGTPSDDVDLDIKDKFGGISISRAVATSTGAAGNIYYLVNNLHYITRLEYGWSKQAPVGMVRVTIAEFQATIARELRKT